MDTTPGTATALVAVLGVLVGVCLVALVVAAVRARRQRAVAAAEIAAARAETARLADQLGALGDQVARLRAPTDPGGAAYVITDAGTPGAADVAPDTRPMVRDSFVLNAALGEPLLRAAALTHGVRRALSPESRARIRVAVRQETRRSRKERRREMREVWLAHKRATRAAGRADGTARAADAA